MRFNFKKISAIGASILLTGMSMGVAAAAAYPSPFVSDDGVGDVAIVYGSNAKPTDQVAATNIKEALSEYVKKEKVTVEGESYPLYTSSSKIYMNDSIATAGRATLTKTELPNLLADGTFEGDVTADYTQTIKIGSYPQLVFGKHPTSDDEPTVAIILSTSTSSPVYNLTVTFDQAVNFTDSDSIGESLNLFGREYTVGAGTTANKLYLYESSETIELSIGGTEPSSKTVTVNGETYTVTLTGATSSSATIKVTDSEGNSQEKTINVDDSKKVQGIDIAVNIAQSSQATSTERAQITVGANKILLQDGSKVKQGSDEDSIDGTLVTISGDNWGACTGFTISVAAESTSSDAIVKGGEFVDPVFGTVSLVFSSLAGDEDRETIKISPSTDKAKIEFTDHEGNSKEIYWYYNDSATARLADSDDSGNDEFKLLEGTKVNVTQYVVVGNENEGYLLELYEFDNDTDSTDDKIVFRNALDPDKTYKVTVTSEGQGNLIVGGKTYTVSYYDQSAEGADYVEIDYPDSSGNNKVIYPTIETSKGAKIGFYEPITLSLGSDIVSGANLKFPNGDGYTDVAVEAAFNESGDGLWWWNFTVQGGSEQTLNVTNTSASIEVPIGQLTYTFIGAGTNSTTVKLEDVGGSAIDLPGLVIFEEKAQSSISSADEKYHALIVKMEGAGTSNAKIGVADVETTWGDDSVWDNLQSEENDDIYYDFDLWGTLVTTDKSDSDSYSVEISYPDEQVNAEVSIAEASAVSTSGGDLGDVIILDTEVSSMKSKNLIIVGGSCVNSAAATLVGGAYCGSAWQEATNVGPGEWLIKSYADSSLTESGKIALLVAGWEAADTTAAATYFIEKKPTISSDTEIKGPVEE